MSSILFFPIFSYCLKNSYFFFYFSTFSFLFSYFLQVIWLLTSCNCTVLGQKYGERTVLQYYCNETFMYKACIFKELEMSCFLPHILTQCEVCVCEGALSLEISGAVRKDYIMNCPYTTVFSRHVLQPQRNGQSKLAAAPQTYLKS